MMNSFDLLIEEFFSLSTSIAILTLMIFLSIWIYNIQKSQQESVKVLKEILRESKKLTI